MASLFGGGWGCWSLGDCWAAEVNSRTGLTSRTCQSGLRDLARRASRGRVRGAGFTKGCDLLTSLALTAIAHGFDGAGLDFFGGVVALAGVDGDGSSEFFFDFGGAFLDVGGAAGAEVVGGLEAFFPSTAVHVAEGAHFSAAEEEVDALALIDPLLTPGGGVDEPAPVDAEGGGVAALEIDGDLFDGVDLAVHVFELVLDLVGPEAALFEVTDEVGIEDHEVAREVGLHEHVAHQGLNARAGAHDVGDGGGGGDGEDVAVAHALLGDLGAEAGPIHFAAAWDVDVHAALLGEEVEGILREEAAIPFAAFVGGVGATLGCEVTGGFVGVVGDGFHDLVIEFDGFFGGEGDAFAVKGVLQAHDSEADGAVTAVGGLGGFGGVEVDVDDVIEHADGDADGLAELGVVDAAGVVEVAVDEDGAEVADGGFVSGGVEGDLGAEVAAVDDAGVVLGASDVAGVFEGDPGVAGLEDGFEHLFPEVDGGDLAAEDFAGLGECLVFDVAFFKGGAVELVEVGDFVGAEEGPGFTGLHAFHEEVGDPVGGVEVVGAAALVTGV